MTFTDFGTSHNSAVQHSAHIGTKRFFKSEIILYLYRAEDQSAKGQLILKGLFGGIV